MSRPEPALAIDASEWFVDEAWREHVARRHWRRLPPRADVAIRLAFERLQELGAQATFFVPATVADRASELLAELLAAGHEVALSVRAQVPLDEVAESDRDGYARAWHQERAALEAALEAGVHGFASPWQVAPQKGDAWWHPVLRELGFAYDATPVRGPESLARALDGSVLEIERFFAWQLDADQPRLMGLPADVRLAHEQLLDGAAARLAASAAAART
ncbi:MAG: hypothetical protein KAI24_21390, partial [Planctomycetes bacterium]|nr:hypothetical protein [Planctomycetota bacterium]